MGISSALLAKKAVDDMFEMAYDVSRGKPTASDGVLLTCLFNTDLLVDHATDYLTNELVDEFNLSVDDAKAIVCSDEWRAEIVSQAAIRTRRLREAFAAHMAMK